MNELLGDWKYSAEDGKPSFSAFIAMPGYDGALTLVLREGLNLAAMIREASFAEKSALAQGGRFLVDVVTSPEAQIQIEALPDNVIPFRKKGVT